MGSIDSERVVVVCFCLHGRDSVESRDNSSGTKPFVVDKLHTNVVRDADVWIIIYLSLLLWSD